MKILFEVSESTAENAYVNTCVERTGFWSTKQRTKAATEARERWRGMNERDKLKFLIGIARARIESAADEDEL